MEEHHQDLKVIIHHSRESLSDEDNKLLDQAYAQLPKAYAPYSGFQVGAALITENGSLAHGANQENASYPLCMCGERIAVFSSAILHPGIAIKTIAIVVKSVRKVIDQPASPCGACRQVLLEFEDRQNEPIRLLLRGETGAVYEFDSVGSLLPYKFDSSYLRNGA